MEEFCILYSFRMGDDYFYIWFLFYKCTLYGISRSVDVIMDGSGLEDIISFKMLGLTFRSKFD